MEAPLQNIDRRMGKGGDGGDGEAGATGEDKAEVAERALKGEDGADCPASLLRGHAAVTWVLDEAAASGLGRC